MTPPETERFGTMCKRVHDLMSMACADLHEALASGDRGAVQLATENMQLAAYEVHLLAVAMKELARRPS
jgi:hypothetical protein